MDVAWTNLRKNTLLDTLKYANRKSTGDRGSIYGLHYRLVIWTIDVLRERLQRAESAPYTIIPKPPQCHLAEQGHADTECHQFLGAISLDKPLRIPEYLILIQLKITRILDPKSLKYALPGVLMRYQRIWKKWPRAMVSTSLIAEGRVARDYLFF